MNSARKRDPLVVSVAMWLTKRRSIIFAPIFATALCAARPAPSPLIEWIQNGAGLLCLWSGTRVRLAAASYHRSSHGKEPITAGPYAWVRHPIYLANFLMGLGIVLIAGWWPIVAVYSIIFLFLHTLLVRSEEISLTDMYGQKYREYCRTVPAIIPWRRSTGPLYGAPNKFKLQRGQERLKIFGYAAGASALIFFKHERLKIQFPHIVFPVLSWVFFLVMALAALIYRPQTKMRWYFVRVVQVVVMVASVLGILVQVPGVWP